MEYYKGRPTEAGYTMLDPKSYKWSVVWVNTGQRTYIFNSIGGTISIDMLDDMETTASSGLEMTDL